MESVRHESQGCQSLFGHGETGGVGVSIQLTLHRQPGLGPGRRNQLEDHSVTGQRFATPVLADPGKEAMLDFIPFTRSRWQVADVDRQPRLIGQLLQFPFPQMDTRAIAASPIRAEQEAFGLRILPLTHMLPPLPDAFHGESCRLMINAHIDPTSVVSQIVDPVGRSSTKALDGKVIHPHLLGFAFGTPFSPRIF